MGGGPRGHPAGRRALPRSGDGRLHPARAARRGRRLAFMDAGCPRWRASTGLACAAALSEPPGDPERLRAIGGSRPRGAPRARPAGNGAALAVRARGQGALRAGGLPVVEGGSCPTRTTRRPLSELGGHVAVKLAAPPLRHKADVGALAPRLGTEDEVRAAHRRLVALGVETPACSSSAWRRPVPSCSWRRGPTAWCRAWSWRRRHLDRGARRRRGGPAPRLARAGGGGRSAACARRRSSRAGADGAAGRPAAARLAAAAGELLLENGLELLELNPVLVHERGAVAVDAWRPRAVRAVVVGAGLAGLVAADELARGGAEVVVLEARSRVGGRVWSQRLANGAVVEMGAEYILPGNTAIRELAEPLRARPLGQGHALRPPRPPRRHRDHPRGAGGGRWRRRRRSSPSGGRPGASARSSSTRSTSRGRPRGDPGARRDLERELGRPGRRRGPRRCRAHRRRAVAEHRGRQPAAAAGARGRARLGGPPRLAGARDRVGRGRRACLDRRTASSRPTSP